MSRKGYQTQKMPCELTLFRLRTTCLNTERLTPALLHVRYALSLIPESKWQSTSYSLNSEISVMIKTLDALKHELAMAQAGLHRAQNAMTITCRIPAVLLSMIFQECWESARYIPEQTAFLKSMTSVCHHWRVVAINTPAMWTDVVLGTGALTPRARAYLERSQSAPIYIHLHAENLTKLWATTQNRRWIDSLRPFLARCLMFTLYTNDQVTAQSVFPLQTAMPELRYISWKGDRKRPILTPDATPVTFSLLDNAEDPNITFLELNVDKTLASVRLDDTYTSNLRTLRIRHYRGMACRDVLEIVHRCPNLRALNWLNDLGEGDSGSSTLSPVSSPSIRILRLQLAADGEPQGSLYNNMSLPSLRHLVIESVRHCTAWADPMLLGRDGKSQSYPYLRTAWLGNRAFSSPAIVDFLLTNPSIEAIGTKIHYTTPGFLHMLCGMASLRRWKESFPNLRYFYLTKASATHKPYYEGVSMSQSEWTNLLATAVRAIIDEYGGAELAKEDGLLVQLNDELWQKKEEPSEIYEELVRRYPDVVVLTRYSNSIPRYFRLNCW